MVRYNEGNDRCLANAATLDDFLAGVRLVLRNCKSALSAGGKFAVLTGDGRHQGRPVGLPFHLMNASAAEGLWLAAQEIIRFGHGATSSCRHYATVFIPRLHDIRQVLENVTG